MTHMNPHNQLIGLSHLYIAIGVDIEIRTGRQLKYITCDLNQIYGTLDDSMCCAVFRGIGRRLFLSTSHDQQEHSNDSETAYQKAKTLPVYHKNQRIIP